MKKLFFVLFLSAICLYAADKKTEAEAFFREYLSEMSRFKTA